VCAAPNSLRPDRNHLPAQIPKTNVALAVCRLHNLRRPFPFPSGSVSALLAIFWLKDEALEDSANLPTPGIIATEIGEDLCTALAQFEEIEADFKSS